MKNLIVLLFGVVTLPLLAFHDADPVKTSPPIETNAFRQDCSVSTAQTDLDINNVRARLLVGGDMWWDGANGKYVVPKVAPGEVEVSSIFAGGIWLGGVDPAGNIKIAAQSYGRSSGESDYWPGPLTEDGDTDQESCTNWDQIFSILGEDIELHIAQFRQAQAAGIPYDESLIPLSIKLWPAWGNPFFFEEAGFELPNGSQGLAPFWDENGTGFYDPQFGDYPVLEIRGCAVPVFADQMSFWIFNDVGNIHTQSGGDALQMEIQAQSFAFATNDEINDMTFSKYKLINRALESTTDTYFGVWLDADLGCQTDDYVGVDTARSLMYVYNQDAIDGTTDTDCFGGTATYGDKVPYFGIDMFRGPLAPKTFDENGNLICPGQGQVFDTIVEIGMSSFIYFNQTDNAADPRTTFPDNAQEYHNFLSGRWGNGDPMTIGGDATSLTGEETFFAFHDEPNNPKGWSMCAEQLPSFGATTLQSAGPFRLDPGQVNELMIGVPWVPDVEYPCPDMSRLYEADDKAQRLFNSCFSRLRGPDAPDMELISLNEKVVGILSNDEVNSNNRFESYSELDPFSPASLTLTERSYIFEGYVIYQLRDGTITQSELNDTDKARIVFQSDRKNEAVDLFNWVPENMTYVPNFEVEGNNEGIRKTFEITEDLFTGEPLINGETYYYAAIAYAFNEYAPFDPVTTQGQPRPYIEGDRNYRAYSVRPSATANSNMNCDALETVGVTRLDGQGVGNNFLSISKEERERILEEQGDQLPASFTGTITYEPEGSPIEVKLLEPNSVVDGEYVLRFDQSRDLDIGASAWELFDAESNESLGRAVQNLDVINEQLFPDLGISIRIGQTDDAGDLVDESNGAIGQRITYDDPSMEWLTPVQDDASFPEVLTQFDLDYQATGPGEESEDLDPNQAYSILGSGHFSPYTLLDWRLRETMYATAAWVSPQSAITQIRNPLERLNNVDIVFTNDKTMWSRCVVVETGNRYFQDAGFTLDDDKDNFEVVDRPSVSKQDSDGDGRPDEDGSGVGFAWFPGYAINVETGLRLNIFFGENSAFGDNTPDPSSLLVQNGSDMMFNPSSQAGISPQPNNENPFDLVLGGMHYIYVTRQAYDECEFINETLRETLTFRRIDANELITWAGIGLGSEEIPMLSYADGLIPTETVVQLRVDNPYYATLGINDNNRYPSYRFSLDCQDATSTIEQNASDKRLDKIEVYPNPYLSTSGNVINIANLPPRSQVSIYSVDGRLVKLFETNKHNSEVNVSLQWDARNDAGKLLPSGAYFIHVHAEGIGQRTLKWINLQ